MGNIKSLLTMAKMLLEAGANPKLKDKDGKTALDYAKNSQIKALLK